jgi:hypothetical protein
MPIMFLHGSFTHKMHELWSKERLRINWEFDSQPQIPLKQGSLIEAYTTLLEFFF